MLLDGCCSVCYYRCVEESRVARSFFIRYAVEIEVFLCRYFYVFIGYLFKLIRSKTGQGELHHSFLPVYRASFPVCVSGPVSQSRIEALVVWILNALNHFLVIFAVWALRLHPLEVCLDDRQALCQVYQSADQ